MPFLHAALQRLLEEFPADADRLSRIERELLTAVKSGAATREALCLATWKMEPWTWGDTSIYLRLDGLASGSRPAVDRLGDLYSLNECGRRLLLGDAEEIRAREVDTWLGGVHIVIT